MLLTLTTTHGLGDELENARLTCRYRLACVNAWLRALVPAG